MENFSKKLLAIALSAILTVSLIPASVFSAMALTPDECADSPVLALDTPTDVSYDGTELSGAFRFVSETDDMYVFYSSGSNDTYGNIMDENGDIFISNDDGGSGNNFKMSFEAEAGKTYYLLSQMYYSNDSGDYTVTLNKYESPVERVEVKSIDLIKDLSGYTDLDGNDQAYFRYQYSNPEYTVYFKDGSEPRTTSYSMYVDGQYYSLEYDDNQTENHWTDLGAYEVDFTFAGYKSTFTVNVVENPVERVEIESVTVIDGQGGYDYGDYYYYNYLTPKYTVYFKDGSHTETDAADKFVLSDYYSLTVNDNQHSDHWTVGNTYTVPCTFMGVDCSFSVNVVAVPVTRVEIEDVVLTENMGGYVTTDYDGNEFFYYNSINRPKYTVYLNDGTHTENNNSDKTVYNYQYSLSYYIDQYTRHFEPGNTYTVPCTFMGVECSFNIIVNPSPISNVVIEDVTVIENIDGYESGYGGDTYFHYSYNTPSFTLYFNDGTEPMTSSYGSVYYNGQSIYLNFSDPQYGNHFTLGENKVPCTVAGKEYEFTVNVIENPVASIEVEEITVYENMDGYISTDYYGQEYYCYSYGSPVYTLHFSDGTVSETNEYSKTVNGKSYYIGYQDDQEENHWTVGNSYDVNWTFMNLSGTFKVNVEPNPILRIEVDPVTVIANVDCYERMDHEGNSFKYYYFSSPQYTVYFRNGGQTEKTSGYTEFNGGSYNLRYNFDQYATHLEAGHTYNVPCTFAGLETSFDIVVKNSPVTNIVFDEVSVIENVSGYTNTDGDGNEFFCYSYSRPSYTVYFDDGTNSGKVSNYIEYEGNTYWPNYSDDQYENHWTVGNTYQVPFTLLGYETSFAVQVKKSPVERVAVDKLVLLEKTSGSIDTDADGQEYFRYSCRPEYVVYLEGGKTTNKTSYSTQIGDRYYNLEYEDTQYDSHWTVGNTYQVPFTFMGYSGTFEVEIKENPVSRVVIEPAEVIENVDGYWDTDTNEQEYFHYSGFSFVYTVYFKDGTHTATNSYNKTINGDSYWLTIYDDQNNHHWTLGGTYNVTCEFMSTECTASVTVVRNPVKSVAVSNITVIENTDGAYRTDKDGNRYYEYYNFNPKYVVTFDDGRVSPEIFGSYQVGNSYYELEFDADQSETHWTVGNTYTVSCTFMGVESSFTVTIEENPIASIIVEDVALIENGSGYYTTDAGGQRYFCYSNFSPKYYVVYKDGTTSTGNTGGIRIGNNWYYLESYTDQRQNHWTVGNTYEVECTFLGVSGKFNVAIVANPIESISVDDISIIENSRGYMRSYGERYFVYQYNPSFTVTYKDGTKAENVSGSVKIGDRYYSIDYTDTQDDVHWEVGNTYSATATLAGIKCNFNVTIIPTPVARVEIEDVTLIKESNGWINTDDNSIEFFEYDYTPRYRVTFKDGTVTELNADEKQYGGESYYLNNFEDNQYNEHWVVGGTYNVTAKFLGVEGSFRVTIVSSPVKSIEVDDIIVIENIGTWTMTDASGVEYQRYPYGVPNYKVNFIDGTSSAKDSKGKEVSGQTYWLQGHDTQNETHWVVGGTYTVECEFLGVKSSFKVTVKPISYFNIPALTLNVPKALSYNNNTVSGLAKFTPATTATYKFYSTGKYYTDGYLYDSTGKQIEEGFGNQSNPNFSIEATLTAGSTYYILTEPFDGMVVGEETYNFNVCVTKSDEPLACTHSETETKNAVEATCTSPGFSGDIYCKACGEKIASGRTVPALGHGGGTATCHSKAVCIRCGVEYGEFNPNNHDGATEIRNAVEATCTEHGYSGDTYCLSCGEMISSGAETPFAEHTVGEWLSGVDGHWRHCSQCDTDVDRAAHEYIWKVTKKATAEENGLKEEICSVCGYKSGNTEEIEYAGYEPGDINGNGEVDNKDLTRLFQYLSNWDVVVNEDALDVNGDKSVDNKDLTRLFQYLSNWDVQIF